MPAPRFFCPFALSPHARVELPDTIAHHAVRVLRLRDGETLALFDGNGGEYPATLRIDGKTAYAELGAHDTRDAELRGAITLVQGLPTGDKMDWIVEKAVELGAVRLVPVTARRSVLQLSGSRQDKRLTHWRRIATAASEQCGRNRIMRVDDPVTLEHWLSSPATGLRLLCHPEAVDTLPAALQAANGVHDVSLIVGPEGGWSEDELAAASQAGVQAVRFGARVLRTETAGLALIAAVTALAGWQ